MNNLPSFIKYKLSNNATALIIPRQYSGMVAIKFFFRAGSRYDNKLKTQNAKRKGAECRVQRAEKMKYEVRSTKYEMSAANHTSCLIPHTSKPALCPMHYAQNKSGLAHFVEHMIFSYTDKNTSKQEVSPYLKIESLGGEIDCGTTKEYSVFGINTPTRHFSASIEILSNLVFNPIFAVDKETGNILFEQEKKVIIEEIKSAEDDRDIILREFAKIAWENHPLAEPILGSTDTVGGTICYNDLLQFYNEHYCGSNMVITISGNISIENTIKILEENIKKYHLCEKKAVNRKNISNQELPFLTTKEKYHIERDLNQTYFLIGFLGPSIKSNDKYAMKLINIALGSGGSSRLFRKVRDEHRLAYFITTFQMSYEDTGYLAILSYISPENVLKIENLIIEELLDIQKNGLSPVELEKAKNIYEGALSRMFETNSSIASIYGIEEIVHKAESFDKSIEQVINITNKTIIKIAKKYFSEKNYVRITIGREK